MKQLIAVVTMIIAVMLAACSAPNSNGPRQQSQFNTIGQPASDGGGGGGGGGGY